MKFTEDQIQLILAGARVFRVSIAAIAYTAVVVALVVWALKRGV